MSKRMFSGVSDASPSKRRKQGIVISYAYTLAQIVVNFLYIPLLLSIIGQDEYGLYQTVGPIMSYVVSINSVLSAGVGRYYSMYKAEGDERMMENTLAIAAARADSRPRPGISKCACHHRRHPCHEHPLRDHAARVRAGVPPREL